MTIDVHDLLDRRRWTGPSRGTHALIARISVDEASAIANDLKIQRAIETFLLQRSEEQPVIRALLMFVRDDDGVAGLIEVLIAGPGSFAWDVAHTSPDDAPVRISRELDGLPRQRRHCSPGSDPDDCN